MAGVEYNLGRSTVPMASHSLTYSGLYASDLLGEIFWDRENGSAEGPGLDRHGMSLRKSPGGQIPRNVAISLAGRSFIHSDWCDLGLGGRSLLGRSWYQGLRKCCGEQNPRRGEVTIAHEVS